MASVSTIEPFEWIALNAHPTLELDRNLLLSSYADDLLGFANMQTAKSVQSDIQERFDSGDPQSDHILVHN